MAKAIVKDGEGATKFIQVEINEAKSISMHEKIARTIAESLLVKPPLMEKTPIGDVSSLPQAIQELFLTNLN
jgi:glutamate N-acetyltransferase/amino-acid N-acetyltransferase